MVNFARRPTMLFISLKDHFLNQPFTTLLIDGDSEVRLVWAAIEHMSKRDD